MRAEDRVIEHWLDDGELVEIRAELCAAAWALFRNWASLGCPTPAKIIPGFENWSQTIGGTLEAAGFKSPTEAPHSPKSGINVDSPTDAIEALVKAIGRSEHCERLLRFDTVFQIASRLRLLRDYLKLDEADTLELGARKRLGLLLKRHHGDVAAGFRSLRCKLSTKEMRFKVEKLK